MTTVTFIPKTCTVCGYKSRQAESGLWHDLGRPEDLDLRPGGSVRNSLYMWMQRCMSCGYCAPDISVSNSKAKEITQSENYRNQLTNRSLPDTANAFLCYSFILESAGRFNDAAWNVLYAAWACDDDAGHQEIAVTLRKKAYDMFSLAKNKSQEFTDSPLKEMLLMIDLLRRTRSFDSAKGLCVQALSMQSDERSMRLFSLEEDLIDANDSLAHRISEALDDPE